MKAVIVAGGFGTRFLPITKTIAKEMLPLGDKPIIEYIVRELTDAGVDKILIVIAHHKEMIKEYFTKNEVLENFLIANGKDAMLEKVRYQQNLAQIDFVYQENIAGFQDAVNCAREWVGDDDFILCTGDNLFVNEYGLSCTEQMLADYIQNHRPLLLTTTVPEDELYKYGVVKFADESTGKIEELIEKPKQNAPSNVIAAGRYLLPAKIFEHMDANQEKIGNEVNFSVSLSNLAKIDGFYTLNFDGWMLDTRNVKGYLEAFEYYTRELKLDKEKDIKIHTEPKTAYEQNQRER